MHPYIPHTADEVKDMLRDIGARSIDDLFADLPEEIRLKKGLKLPQGLSEYEVLKKVSKLADKNDCGYVSYLGAGSYDHIVPSTIGHVLGRSEFYTSYTPYQAEMAQGTLQSIFEFQSLICELTALDVSNASLYDGHTAASEAAVMGINSVRDSKTVLISEYLHPQTKQVLKTFFFDMGIEIAEVKGINGQTSLDDLKGKLTPEVACFIGQSPNFVGIVEDFTGFADLLHAQKKIFVISSNPMALPMLKTPGEWGADIAIGDAQPFGLPMDFGGPSVGFMAAREPLLRKMPGRIVGQTVDREGKRGFVLTLQAREQHIKRERATSNICSNQALMALGVTVYMALAGKQGLRDASVLNLRKAHYLAERIVGEKLGTMVFDRPFFNEFAIRLTKPVSAVVDSMRDKGILAGIQLEKMLGKAFENCLLVAVTEKRTREELDTYVAEMKGI